MFASKVVIILVVMLFFLIRWGGGMRNACLMPHACSMHAFRNACRFS